MDIDAAHGCLTAHAGQFSDSAAPTLVGALHRVSHQRRTAQMGKDRAPSLESPPRLTFVHCTIEWHRISDGMSTGASPFSAIRSGEHELNTTSRRSRPSPLNASRRVQVRFELTLIRLPWMRSREKNSKSENRLIINIKGVGHPRGPLVFPTHPPPVFKT